MTNVVSFPNMGEDSNMNSTEYKEITLKSGEKRLQKSIYLGRKNGRSIRTTVTARTKRELKQKVAQKRVEFGNANNDNKSVYSRKTVQKLYDEFYKDYYIIYVNPAPSTRRRMRGIANNYFLKYFGNKLIEEVTTDECNKYLQWLHNKVPNSLDKYIQYSSKVFWYAASKGYIESNPFDYIFKYSQERTANSTNNLDNVLSKDEVDFLLDELPNIFPNNQMPQVAIRLAIFSGLRRGELLAIKWKNIDFEKRTLSVTHAITTGEHGCNYLTSNTKTSAAHRTIPLDIGTIGVLKNWKATQSSILRSRGIQNRYNEQFVFANTKNKFITLSYPEKWMNKVRAHCGFANITFHGLRHTYASLQHEAGINELDIARTMGHTDSQVTTHNYIQVPVETLQTSNDKFASYMAS